MRARNRCLSENLVSQGLLPSRRHAYIDARQASHGSLLYSAITSLVFRDDRNKGQVIGNIALFKMQSSLCLQNASPEDVMAKDTMYLLIFSLKP